MAVLECLETTGTLSKQTPYVRRPSPTNVVHGLLRSAALFFRWDLLCAAHNKNAESSHGSLAFRCLILGRGSTGKDSVDLCDEIWQTSGA